MLIWPPFHLVGITHRKADLELRERFARSPEELAALLGAGARTGVILSTCNRFEVYWWGAADWPAWFADTADQSGARVPGGATVRHSGFAAIRHLFSVAAGLDSQVLGEHEILGQVRRAWAISRDAMASTRELDLVFAASIAAARRVRRETALGSYHGSIGSVAVDAAEAGMAGLQGRHAVVIGAGEAARGVVAALAERGSRISVVARHAERARALAESYAGVRIVPWERLSAVMGEADVIFAATSAPQAFLSRPSLASVRVGAWVIDLGVPRNVDPDAGMNTITVLDLDDLQSSGKARMVQLGRSIEAARLMLDREATRLLEKLERWSGVVRGQERQARADTAG